MDCSPPGSSVHGIFEARVPFPSPGDLPDPEIEPTFPALQVDSVLLSHFLTKDTFQTTAQKENSLAEWV